ncbi:hypothetical protein AB0I66_21535 [Streptomyces sp. NPDC050439]|uniref:hypothetical protein n=1 Tax=unclassified Streptomyces TaxID=2593676 RepID=UPI0034307A7F
MSQQPEPTEAERVAALQLQAAADYAKAQALRAEQEAAARDQLAHARAHGNEQGGTR